MSNIEDDFSDVPEFQSLFREFGFDVQTDEISEWISSDRNESGCEALTDAEICDLVSAPEVDREDGSDEAEQPGPVSHSKGAEMFEQCLTWLEH